MLLTFISFSSAKKLSLRKGVTLLAVSGGVDSVVMSWLFRKAGFRFSVAHCNFGLRGIASDQDETWVRALARQQGVSYYTQRFDAVHYAHMRGISIQMAARELRYAWFQQLCEEHGFEKVATAHHSGDSLETALLCFTRGTGIAGLRGIVPAQGKYVRPLLFASKHEIIAYAKAHNLTWREDDSNTKSNYKRNFIRHKVIPQLSKLNPSLEDTFKRTSERLQQTEAMLKEYVAAMALRMVHRKGLDFYVSVATIQHKPWAPLLVWQLLQSFGFNFAQINNFWGATLPPSGKMLLSPTHVVYVDRKYWVVTPRVVDSSSLHLLESTTTTLEIPPYVLRCARIPVTKYNIVQKEAIAALDRDRLKFPLITRKWRSGDYFYPLGMQHKKKLSDFFIDAKVPLAVKAQTWVVISGEDIVCILGHRIDDRFKITDYTQQVYEIQLCPVVT